MTAAEYEATVGTRARRRAQANARRRGAVPTWVWWVVCGLIALMVLFPLVVLLLTVVKTPSEATSSPPSYLPSEISGQNFADLTASGAGIVRYVANSVVVSVGAVVGSVIVSTLAGYGFARFHFPARGVLFGVVLLSLMIPFQALVTPLYMVLQFLHLQNSLIGLTLAYTTFFLPLTVFLMRNSFAAIPAEIAEAAQIDGCSVLGGLLRVMVPMVIPGIVSVALFSFFNAWNEFLVALVVLSDDAKFTLPVFLTTIVSGRLGAIEWGLLQAGVLVTMVPCVVIFLLLQRYYVKGLVSGAVK